jgi:V8-like Glu-specific endopeptidase
MLGRGDTMITKICTFGLLGLFISTAAHALPLPKGNMSSLSLPADFTADYNFEGIVGLSNCSGSFIRLENSRDTDNAMVLTNGHCLESGMPGAGQVVYGKPSNRTFKLYNTTEVVGRLNATQIIYSTMTKTDMTLYKVKETYAEVKAKYGVNPMTLSSQHPSVNDPIEVISGYWYRGYTCNIEAFINTLKEDQWTMNDSIRYSRPGCLVIGGTSGSPIVLKNSRTVIGINNTGNESGYKCTMNNPCEVDEKGTVTATRGFSYGQETYWLYTCLNQYNEVDLSVSGCMLPH